MRDSTPLHIYTRGPLGSPELPKPPDLSLGHSMIDCWQSSQLKEEKDLAVKGRVPLYKRVSSRTINLLSYLSPKKLTLLAIMLILFVHLCTQDLDSEGTSFRPLDLDLKESYPLGEAPPRSSVLLWEGKSSISSLSILFASTSSKWLPAQLKFLVISVLLLVNNSLKMTVNAQMCT